MRFINQTTNYSLSIAAKLANDLISNPDSDLHKLICSRIRYHWAFDNIEKNVCSSAVASGRIISGPESVSIYTYRPLNPFTSAIAMTNGDGAIHFNIYKLKKLQVTDLIKTITHEYAHLCGFGHGNNFKTRHKCIWSLPFTISEEKWV